MAAPGARRVVALWGWAGRRRFPLLAMAGLIAAGMFATTWAFTLTRTWEAQLTGKAAFALPADLWSTLAAAIACCTWNLAACTPADLSDLLSRYGADPRLGRRHHRGGGLGLAPPRTANPHPGAWLLAGPYARALSGTALHAAVGSCPR